MMNVASVNDGPVTFIVDSEEDFSSSAKLQMDSSTE